jgi:hypothetical protein
VTAHAPRGSRVLAVGVYLADREHRAPAISGELARSERWTVDQRWAALGRAAPPAELAAVTVERVQRPTPKFVLVNRLLAACDLDRYTHLLVCDDDVTLPDCFVDRYLEEVERHDLALAQPARSHESWIDHPIVEQLDGLRARRTRFVEIGPVFSIARQAFHTLLPFDEASPMGWGYDFVWPVIVERAGLRMGIVDATPVAHDLRPPVAFYSEDAATAAMDRYLAEHPHLSRAEAFAILEAFA